MIENHYTYNIIINRDFSWFSEFKYDKQIFVYYSHV